MTPPLASLFGNEPGCSAAGGLGSEPSGGGGCLLGKPNSLSSQRVANAVLVPRYPVVAKDPSLVAVGCPTMAISQWTYLASYYNTIE